MKIFLRNLLLVGLLCSINVSCTEWLTVQPKTQLTADDMFKSKAGFKDALTGVYITMQNLYTASDGSQLVVNFVEHLACQWDGIAPESKEELMNLHEYYDLDGEYKETFRELYKVIAGINVIMPYLENGVLDKTTYSRIKGELLALRAYLHFDLVRLWGPIPNAYDVHKKYLPYVKTIQTDPFEYITYDNYMLQLNQDLNDSQILLQYWYDNDQIAPYDKKPAYMRKYQVAAFRARVSLWQGEKTEAIEYAKEVLKYAKDKNAFSLGNITDINNGDLSLTKEHIFGVTSNVDKGFTTSQFVYTDDLMKFYENSGADIRLNMWKTDIGEKEVPAKNCIKYYFETSDEPAESDYVISVPLIRLAELYLLLIECLDIEEANAYYEEFCASRGVGYIPFTDIYKREEILITEFRKEFVAEGQLFYAYKRWNLKAMPKCVRPCGPESYVIPIPRGEFDLN